MHTRVLYVPGVGAALNPLRRIALALWRRPGLSVTLVPIDWSASGQSAEQTLAPLMREIDRRSGETLIVVGESAGGAAAIVAMRKRTRQINKLVTLCGMNTGSGSVGEAFRAKYPSFIPVIVQAEQCINGLSQQQAAVTAIYSSRDTVIKAKNTIIPGAKLIDLRIRGHMIVVSAVLLFGRAYIFK